uniref:Copia protein n=1 Tax=Cajanus cajan TaxID=3821 RepID=A0A151S4Q2_CAJCA|nr:hypothetical protein KK1_028466 [Cajanus cajan]
MYRRLIGHLIYLITMHPNITHLVQHLSQFVSNPTSAHHQVAFRILHYLKGTPCSGIFLATNSTLHLKGSSLISWHSKKQLIISQSSSKAHEGTKHIEIDCHIMCDELRVGLIKLLPVSSSLQLVDIYTKTLSLAVFRGFCSKLGMLDISFLALE